MRLINCLIILLLFISDLYADHGIYFKSNEVSKESRTGIDLTHQNNISYSSDFSIHFKISFRETETYYGDILSLKESNGNNLIQVNFQSPDLFVIHNKRETKFHLNLEDLNIPNNRWVDFELHIDAVNRQINLKFGNKTLQSSIQFAQNSDFALSLGVVNKYGFYIDEVPSISIKDLGIRIDGSPKHLWPFKKTSQDLLRDVLSSRTAKLYNPDWVVDYHNKWVKINSFSFDRVSAFAYNKKTETIDFIQFDGKISSYNLGNKTLTEKSENKGFPSLESSQQTIYNSNYQLTSYSFNKDKISKYFSESNKWSNNMECSEDDVPKFWHHNKLIHPITKQVTTLCGYGYYSYYNLIQSFNEQEQTWQELTFAGDTIEPRYLASFGLGNQDPTIGYLFGGLGNSMGKQILGKEFYTDLYKIDFKNKTIEELWDYKCDDEFQQLPINSLKVTKKDSSFYTLMYPSKKRNTYLKAVKGYINEPKLIFIGDSIPYNFFDIESFADLYYWESENKLIALTSHKDSLGKYQVDLYSISYEPGNQDDFNINKISLPLPVKLFYILLAACAISVVLVIRKRILKAKQVESEIKYYSASETIGDTEISDYQIPKSKSILLFGGFQVFDDKDRDITYRFSPTLKELFLLILLNTMNDGKGISSKRIQEYLWPDKPESKAKNNRGVNIKKLRGILEDISDMEVLFDNNYWKIVYSEDTFFDVDFIQKNLHQIKETGNKENLDKVITVLKKGTMLRDIFPEWLDSFKDKITGLIVNSLEEIVKDPDNNKSINLALSNVIFEFDEMNEAALKLKCCILSEQGKHSLAIETYEHYRKLYQKYYNEEYQYSFKDLVAKE